MRRLVLALMIALLPLRGWVGDAMAMEMAAATLGQPAAVMGSGVGYAHGLEPTANVDADNAMHADCPGHAASHDGDPQATSDCGTCAACHAVALASSFPQLEPSTLASARPPSATPRFASAERTLGIKPPIS
jgi:hypothetical protein